MKHKKHCVIQSPVCTTSGYGARSRDFIRAFIKKYDDDFNIELVATAWGGTSWSALSDEDEDILSRLSNRLKPFTNWGFQPDLFIQITVPNEFQNIGKVSVGVTAAIESTVCHPDIIAGINRMDLNLVSSEHAKTVLLNSGQVQKPVETLFEGYNSNIYKKLPNSHKNTPELELVMNEVGDFNFLFVGHWLKGEVGQDRKDIGMLVKVFYETFISSLPNKPGLILKTSCGGYSHMDHTETAKRLQQIKQYYLQAVKGNEQRLPKVHLLHGELTDSEMNELYNHNKVKAHVSFFKGEGFGRPLLEASVSGKPVIATDWSGPKDFLHPLYSIKLPFTLGKIHPSATDDKFLIEGGMWATVDYNVASKVLKDVYHNYSTKYRANAKKHTAYSQSKFTLDHMADLLKTRLDNYIEEMPTMFDISLPSEFNMPNLAEVERKD